MMVALRPLIRTRSRRLLAFALLLFNPMTMNSPISARVDRSGIYPALTVLLLACLVGLVSTCGRPRRATWRGRSDRRCRSARCGPSARSGCCCCPRWCAGWCWRSCGWRGPRSPSVERVTAAFGVVCIPLTIVVGTLWVEHVNDSHYGLAITNVEQTSMSAGLGPMFRVDPATTFDQFPVTAETRELLYDVSPTFAALRGEIEAGGSDRFASMRPDGVRDLGGQVFQWVVLDAIATTGGAATARDLDDTFRSIGARDRCGVRRRSAPLRSAAQRYRAGLGVEQPSRAGVADRHRSAQDGRPRRLQRIVAGRRRDGRRPGAVRTGDERTAGARAERLPDDGPGASDQCRALALPSARGRRHRDRRDAGCTRPCGIVARRVGRWERC